MTPKGFKYMLPEDFIPSEFDVVIGRGKRVKYHPGNQRFNDNIRIIADDYASGDKSRKSFLLGQLVKQVYINSPHAGFVKKDPATGRYVVVEDALARTTAAQAVRDYLHNHYKSSRQFKQQRRRFAREQASSSSSVSSSRSTTPTPNPMPGLALPSLPTMCQPKFAPENPFNQNSDLFSILAGAFGNDDEQDDPFAPVPLPENTSLNASPANPSRRASARIMQELSQSLSSILEESDQLLEPLPLHTYPYSNLDDIFA